MSKLTKKYINELEDVFSRGNEECGTQEMVEETYYECMEELQCEGSWDELTVVDLNENEIILQDLLEKFYDKIIEKVINVLND